MTQTITLCQRCFGLLAALVLEGQPFQGSQMPFALQELHPCELDCSGWLCGMMVRSEGQCWLYHQQVWGGV